MIKKIWFFPVAVVCIAAGLYWIYQRAHPSMKTEWLVVIPGITGDLAKRRLIPALYHLHKRGERSIIIGTGRRAAHIHAILAEAKKFIPDVDVHAWHEFSKRLLYERLDPNNSADFRSLASTIAAQETKHALSGKRLIYLSLPADVYCPITRQLVENGIVIPDKNHFIAYEKPFGWSLASAQEIQSCLISLLPQKQTYHVDHYVAKGLTQKLPYISELNPILKDILNGSTVKAVVINFHEKIDIEGRGQFYDRFGAIKDVIQNHVLQLLAFFGADLSKNMNPEQQARQRAAFLSSLAVVGVHKGQYEGYKIEKDVYPDVIN